MASIRCDIFCKVIDNYGDIGVCWRLARQLAHDHGIAVRLWVDDLPAFSRIAPGVRAEIDSQRCCDVEIRIWDVTAASAAPADIVIEGFACEPPADFLLAMARTGRRTAWINLEYLSAEAWVDDCHRVPSPHPQLGIARHFFFPGFTENTGGLLKESDLDAWRTSFLASKGQQLEFWASMGVASPPADSLKVSLFAYPHASVGSLLDAWRDGSRSVHAFLPDCLLRPSVEAWCKRRLQVGESCNVGALSLQLVPFMAQTAYDRLLWSCDLNFVRGEDSFVRAQWAQRPLVWHIYRQEDEIHRTKLDAFLARYESGLRAQAAEALRNFWHAWDREADLGPAWADFEPHLPELTRHAKAWAEHVAIHGDLASKLLIFCRDLLS